MSPEVIRILSSDFPARADSDLGVRRLSLLAAAYANLHQEQEARAYLAQADAVCSKSGRAVCIYVTNAHWADANARGQSEEAFQFASAGLALAQRYGLPFDQAVALINLAVTDLQMEHFDEAIDWLKASSRIAESLGAEDILLTNAGNLGWAYYSLGDRDRAFALFQDAERRAVELGDSENAINWLTTIGYVEQDSQQWPQAEAAYRQALAMAEQTNNRDKIINSLESLAHISIQLGQLDDADSDLRQLDPLVAANTNRLDALDVLLARGRIAAARRQDQQAEAFFRQVEADPASQITMRLGAEHELALLFERQGRLNDANNMYSAALATFESARDQIRNEDSKIPFFANATPIYDDDIRLLISQGKTEEALAAADQSRARTLAQGLGVTAAEPSPQAVAFHPGAFRPGAVRPGAPHLGEIAARTGATLLFYWLGEKHSWLWVIRPDKTDVFPLPSQAEIARLVRQYRTALQAAENPLAAPNQYGIALYRTLVAPAQALLPSNAGVIILSDGVLSELNFETLIVPAPESGPESAPAPHYWIEDANIVSAPSLRMLASARPPHSQPRRLLLIGNAVSPGADYPELANAHLEMEHIRGHFRPDEETVFERDRANSAAYLTAGPERYAYIDFVAHGVASSNDPLDSAIILSRTPAAEDSFRLYARDIMRQPIDARLVTIAACYGTGSRAYAGEGLVGLSWAFLYAGAHNVIGALWEVSDASTPLLMDALYQNLENGLPPGAALRQAKLSLLHSPGPFRHPFYWAPFQLYTGT